MDKKVILVLRIFDYYKTIGFYVRWLEFTIDWEHRFEHNSPIYMQVSKEHIKPHLTEHHGDCSPGGKVFIEYSNLKTYHRNLLDKQYKYNRPGIENPPWGRDFNGSH